MTGERGLPRGSVAVVGPGRVGTVLAAALEGAGHRVVAAAGRGGAALERFAQRFAGAATSTSLTVVGDAAPDLIVLAVPDDAVPGVADTLAVGDLTRIGQRVVHVAGSLGLAPLRHVALSGARTAACHPAQTVPSAADGPDVLRGAAWAVTARADDRAWARDLVEQLGGHPHDVPEDRRILYHAGLVVGANAVGAAVSAARRLLLAAGVDAPERFLAPLVTASVDNVLQGGAQALTGPVVRGDLGTLRRHLLELDGSAPELAAVYRDLGRVILAQIRPELPADRAEEIADLFGGA